MPSPPSDMLDLEIALLRRALDERRDGPERCSGCGRTPLIGERVYLYEPGVVVCELCRGRQRSHPAQTRLVHGPEFGHTMRISDHRAAV